MNHLDQLLRDTLAERADQSPIAAPVIDRVLDDVSDRWSWGRMPVVVAGIAATVATGAVGATLLTQVDTSAPVAAPPGSSAGGVLERCLELGAAALPTAHWGEGGQVLTAATDGDRTRAAIVSADGRQWADCALAADDQGHVHTYPMTPAVQGAREFGNFGGTEGEPDTFSMVERFPRNVSEVTLRFTSGAEFTAEAVDGFVAFQISGAALGDADIDALYQYDDGGRLVGGPGMGPGDADLPLEQRSLMPAEPVAAVEEYRDQ